MKSTSVFTAVLATGLVSAGAIPPSARLFSEVHPHAKRQSKYGAIAGLPDALSGMIPMIANSGALPWVVKSFVNGGYGKQGYSKGVPVEQTNRNPQIPGAKTTKIRYGPYTVPNSARKNIVGEAGTLFNYPDNDVLKPCEGACTVLGLKADLEYADGSNANIGNGMWLHHMVLFNVGPSRMDPTCVGQTSLPHLLIGSDPGNSERLIASGNERGEVRFTSPYNPTERLGYFMKSSDKFRLIVDFMNTNKQDKTVYLTITYDYIPNQPEGFSNFKSIWFDAAQCGTSEIKAPQESGKFTIGPVDWTANLDAEILGAGGHLHDGGVAVQLTVDGKVVCDSEATYGVASNGTTGGMGAMRTAIDSINRLVNTSEMTEHGPEDEMEDVTKAKHIVAMSPCFGKTMGIPAIKKGQKWSITATYDYDKYMGMKEGGKQSNVMAIAMMFVKNPKL